MRDSTEAELTISNKRGVIDIFFRGSLVFRHDPKGEITDFFEEAARDEALLAANASSSVIEHVRDLAGGRRKASIAIFRDDALSRLENALTKLKLGGDEERQEEMGMEDKVITCAECGGQFHWSADEQAYYTAQGYAPPKRCKPCRQAKKAQREDADQRGGKQ